MDKYVATLELLPPRRFEYAFHFVDVMERAGFMAGDEAATWRVKIEAWCRFRLRVKPARAGWHGAAAVLEDPDPVLS